MYLFDASSLNFCDEAIHKLFWATLNCIYDQTDDETFNLWDTGSYKTRNGTEWNQLGLVLVLIYCLPSF